MARHFELEVTLGRSKDLLPTNATKRCHLVTPLSGIIGVTKSKVHIGPPKVPRFLFNCNLRFADAKRLRGEIGELDRSNESGKRAAQRLRAAEFRL
jgi:hypothetical protein